MKAIWKYTLENKMAQIIDMPIGARVVHVGNQFEQPTIWVEVDPFADKEPRSIGIATTGMRYAEDEGDYVGTFMLAGGQFLGHIIVPKAKP